MEKDRYGKEHSVLKEEHQHIFDNMKEYDGSE